MDVIRPALTVGDAGALAHAVRVRWTPRQVASLLRHADTDIRRSAATVLALVGNHSCINALARALGDDDWRVSEIAEQAMWAIWFQAPNHEAGTAFRHGLAAMHEEQYDEALAHLDHALVCAPQFSEAHNQRAVAHFLAGRWRPSIADCLLALERMPCHFGALTGLGNCHMQCGELEQAITFYRKAVRINPRLTNLVGVIDQLQEKLVGQLDNSGMFDVGLTLG